jgi:hypothetical protein
MKRLALFISPIVIASSALAQSSASCVTHFYNKSNFPWSISNFDSTKTSLVIQPNTTASINWGTTTEVTISGNIPNRPYVRQFQVQAAGSCVTIQHQGNTGSVMLNKPGAGDVTTCAGGC